MASDLLLLAVRYIAGELPADENAAFEFRLATDQGAREAVAQAVELAGAVAQLPPAMPSVLRLERTQPRRRRLALLAAAASLALAAGVAVWTQRGPRPPSPPVVAKPGQQPESVVLAWSGLRQTGEIDLVSHSELVAWLDEPVGSPVLDALMADVDDDGLPAWLLEATSLRDASPSPTGEN